MPDPVRKSASASRLRTRAGAVLVCVAVAPMLVGCGGGSRPNSVAPITRLAATVPPAVMRSAPEASVVASTASRSPNVTSASASVSSTSVGVVAPLSAVPQSPDELALASDGTLYIADGIENAIYKRTAAGVFSIFAGTGAPGFTGDGGPATAADLNDPSGMLIEADGTLLFADGMNNRLRAVAPDGRISTIAGNGEVAIVTRPGPATTEPVANPKDVAIDPHGGYYVATINQLLHLGVSGQLTVIAGTNRLDGIAGLGGPALSGSVDGPGSIAVDRAGGIFVAGQNTKTLLYITPNGTLTKVSDDFYVRGWGGLRLAPDGAVIGIDSLQIV